MRLLENISIQKRLWINLFIGLIFLTAVFLSARLAFIEVNQSANKLSDIQKSQTVKIAQFQTKFSTTSLQMNKYIRSMSQEDNESFNRQIDELKELNLSLKSLGEEQQPIQQADSEEGALSPTNTYETQQQTAQEQAAESAEALAEESTGQVAEKQDTLLDVDEMDVLLMNMKKSANSSVFLKQQIDETLEYGIEPSVEKIQTNIKQLMAIEDLEEETKEQFSEILRRLDSSQTTLFKMLSSGDLTLKEAFHNKGLGDSSNKLFESLNERFSADFINQDTFSEVYSGWEGYYESFSDMRDYLRTVSMNNQSINKLSTRANELLHLATQKIDQQTSGQIEALNGLSESKTAQITIGSAVALLFMLLLNFFLVKSITTPLSRMKKQVMDIAENGTFQAWEIPYGRNELTEMGVSIQTLLDSVSTATSEITQVSQALADGQFSARMVGEYNGDLNSLEKSFNGSLQGIVSTFQAINQVSTDLAQGKLDANIQLQAFHGDYHHLMTNLQQAIQVQKESINSVIQVMQGMTQGDFSQRIQIQLPGEYTRLKQYLNDSLDSLEHSIDTKNDILDNYKQGDFSYQSEVVFNGKLNELKSNMDRMAFSISDMLQTVKQASSDAVNGVEEISTGNQDLNRRVQNQAASIQKTSQHMDQMAQSVTQSLQQASDVNGVSHSVKQTIEQGNRVVAEMDQAMQGIFSASQEIGEITQIIDSIAFQTNLLALNAAVEAARAGEAGRGFAVVAGEVRSLAQKSADAAKQIRTVSASSMEKVESGIKLSRMTTETFEENSKAIEQVSSMVAEMHESLQLQTHGIQEVSHALNEIDDATQQNAALVEEIATTSANIIDQVRNLEESVKTFTILEAKNDFLPAPSDSSVSVA